MANKMMLCVFVILVLDLIAFTVILPLLPSILDNYEAKIKNQNESKLMSTTYELMNWVKDVLRIPNNKRYNNVLIGGILGSLFSLLQFISNPLFGALSDVIGRKKTMIISMCGTVLSYYIWMKSTSFEIFLLSRIIGGFWKGSVTIATTIMTDITSKENRAKGMALIGIAFGVGFTVGPLLGVYYTNSQQKHDIVPYYGAALLSTVLQIIALLFVLLFLVETNEAPCNQTFSQRFSSAMQLANPVKLLKSCFIKSPNISLMIKSQLTIIHFFYLLFFSGLEFTLTFLTHQRLNFSNKEQGMLFLYIGFLIMIIQGGYVRRVKHGNEKKLVLYGIISMIPSMAIVSISFSVPLLCVALFFYSFGCATVVPCLTALFSYYSDEDETGEMLGIFRSAGALARAIGPIFMCSIYWTFGSKICYSIGGILFVIPILLLSRLSTMKLARE